MIDDENHPEWVAVTKALFEQIVVLCEMSEGITNQLIDGLEELCRSATAKARAHGLDYPDVIVMYMLKARLVRVYRRDATAQMINSYIVTLIREMRENNVPLEAGDLAAGFRRAFPHYHPDDVLAKIKPN